ncbi:MAG TPA: ATP-binding protein [bacterium]|nr:ATP-binding protein [bacterium]HPQ67006.1 ATP-binding protein [bacterium]
MPISAFPLVLLAAAAIAATPEETPARPPSPAFRGETAAAIADPLPAGPHILFINSYHPGYVWSDDILAAFREEIAAYAPPPEIFVEYLDTKHFYGKNYFSLVRSILAAKYPRDLFDLVVVSDDRAFEFMLERGDSLFPRVPVVFCGVNNFDPALLAGRDNYTGVLEDIRIEPALEMIETIHPDVRRVYLVGGSTGVAQNTLKFFARSFGEDSRFRSLQVEILSGAELTTAGMLEKLQQAEPGSVVLFMAWFRDRNGVFVDEKKLAAEIVATCPVPVYSMVNLYQGMVGGRFLTAREQGRTAAVLARRILEGTPPSAIPVSGAREPVYVFDDRQLGRWGILPETLPRPHTLLNRPPGLYRTYRRFLLGGAAFILVESGLIVGLVLLVVRMRRTRKLLRESEEKYRLVVDNLRSGVVVIQKGLIVFANSYIREILGGGRDDLVGKTADTVIRAHSSLLQAAEELPDLSRPFPAEPLLELVDGEGELRRFEIRFARIPWQGRPAVLAVMFDITDKSRMEEQLRQTMKMEAVGRLAGGIAHDFNNILHVILGFAQVLTHSFPPGSRERGNLENIVVAGNRGADLTRQLLAFSRRETPAAESINPVEAVGKSVELIERIIGENIRIERRDRGGTAAIRIEPVQLDQILMNLCLNSRDAMPGGGTISISVDDYHPPREFYVVHPELTAARYVRITVADEGGGIAPERLEHVLEPFYTTKEAGKGTGLGLSTVYAIVRRHGGALDISSSPGVGTTISVFLPAEDDGPRSDADPDQGAESGAPGKLKTILLAEDDDMARALAAGSLRRKGFDLIEAEDGERALELLRRHLDTVDFLVLDVVMPGKNGREVYEEAQRLRPGIPVLFCTGYSRNCLGDDLLDALPPGSLLQKPYTEEELLRAIARFASLPAPAPASSPADGGARAAGGA